MSAILTVLVVALVWFGLADGVPTEATDSRVPARGAPDTGAMTAPGATPATGAGVPEAADAAATGLANAQSRALAGSMKLQLFVVVPGMERLIPVVRDVEAPPTLAAQAQRAVEELLAWNGVEMVSPLPPEARVREVWVSATGIAYVDFDRSVVGQLASGSLGEIHAVYGVVATLTQSFPEIRAVQILLDAEETDTLAGHVDISRPLVPLSDWVIIEDPVDH